MMERSFGFGSTADIFFGSGVDAYSVNLCKYFINIQIKSRNISGFKYVE